MPAIKKGAGVLLVIGYCGLRRLHFLYAQITVIIMPIIATAQEINTETTHGNTASTLLLGKSGEWWEAAMLVTLAIAGVAAVVVFLATAASVVANKREKLAAERELDRYKLEVESKVADAKQEGIAAGRTAGDALVRAAQLEKDAENARLETQRLKQVVAWRELSQETSTKLLNALKLNPGSVNIRYTDGDPEALYLTIQISNVLSSAGWSVAPGSSKMNAIVFGIALIDGENAAGRNLGSALTAAGITFSTGSLPAMSSGLQFNVTILHDAPTLFVGSREPAKLR